LTIDRACISRFGLTIEDVQEVISMAPGGMTVTRTVEGRERFPVRIRYPRELRNDLEQFERVLVPTADGAQIPLKELVNIHYQRG
jgi:copper/silver efflux system protein